MKVIRILSWVLLTGLAAWAAVWQLARVLFEVAWWHSLGRIDLSIQHVLWPVCLFVLGVLLSVLLLNLSCRPKTRRVHVVIWLCAIGGGVYFARLQALTLLQLFPLGWGQPDPFFHLPSTFYMFRMPLVMRLLYYWLGIQILSLLLVWLQRPGVFLHQAEDQEVLSPYAQRRFGGILCTGILIGLGRVLEALITRSDFFGMQDFAKYVIGKGSFLLLLALILWFSVLHMRKGRHWMGLWKHTLLLGTVWLVFQVWLPKGLDFWYIRANTLRAERPFLQARLQASKDGLLLHNQQITNISSFTDVQAFSNLITHTRIWDKAPFLEASRQLQSIHGYLDFFSVADDLYEISNQQRLVLIAVREFSAQALPDNVRTWENLTFRYTHGHGVVVSPSTQVGENGQPVYWLRDLGLQSRYPAFELDHPEIYFGQQNNYPVVLNAQTASFQFNEGVQAIPRTGMAVNSLARRVMVAIALKERRFLLNSYLTRESRLLIRRNILQRVQALFPYFRYDPVVTPVILNRRLLWVVDAYVASDRYPLAEPFPFLDQEVNYLRAPARVVVDGFDGSVRFYRTDLQEPVSASYAKAFPRLFEKEIPQDLAVHFRYPRRLFATQQRALTRYHITDPGSFYNGDDEWKIPSQTSPSNQDAPPESYYTLTWVDTNRVDIGLLAPYTPLRKENLAGWVVGSLSNGQPRLARFRLDRSAHRLGPLQVSAQIRQDPEMAQLFTLWDQSGSSVSYGQTQLIPSPEQDILYVKTLFLNADALALPEVARITAIGEQKRVYATSIPEFYRALLQDSTSAPGSRQQTLQNAIQSAYQLYLEARIDDLQGDIQAYKAKVDKIGSLLQDSLHSGEQSESRTP